MELIRKYKTLLLVVLVLAAGVVFIFFRFYQNDVTALTDFTSAYKVYDQAMTDYSKLVLTSNPANAPAANDLEAKANSALVDLNTKAGVRLSSLIKNDAALMQNMLQIAGISGKEFDALKAYQNVATGRNANLEALAKSFGDLTNQRQAAYDQFQEFAGTKNSTLASPTPLTPVSSTAGSTPSLTAPPTSELVPSTPTAPLPTPTYVAPFGLPPQTINDYLASHVGVSSFGGKVFCAFEKMGASEDTANPRLFVWALCQEYYGQKSLDRGTGMSLPVVLFLQKAGNAYTITSNKIPGSGTLFGPDVRTLFPQDTWDSIFGADVNAYNLRAQTLLYDTESDALAFFGLTSKETPRPTYTPVQ